MTSHVEKLVSRIGRVILGAIVIAYFILDAAFVSLFKPLYQWLKTFNPWIRFLDQVEKLPRYPALFALAVPVALFEPVKPIGLYWLAQGHVIQAGLIILIGEILKVTIIHSLFHRLRPKLLTIDWFEWRYVKVVNFINYMTVLPAYVFVRTIFTNTKSYTKKYLADLKARIESILFGAR